MFAAVGLRKVDDRLITRTIDVVRKKKKKILRLPSSQNSAFRFIGFHCFIGRIIGVTKITRITVVNNNDGIKIY